MILVFGITYTTDLNSIPHIYFKKQIRRARQIRFTWSRRNLSQIGKVTGIKSLILPFSTHLFISFSNPPPTIIENLETMFYNFSWNGKRDTIKREARYVFTERVGYEWYTWRALWHICKLRVLNDFWSRKVHGKIYSREISATGIVQNWYICQKNNLQSLLPYVKNRFWKDVFRSWASVKTTVTDPNTLLGQSLITYVLLQPALARLFSRDKSYFTSGQMQEKCPKSRSCQAVTLMHFHRQHRRKDPTGEIKVQLGKVEFIP